MNQTKPSVPGLLDSAVQPNREGAALLPSGRKILLVDDEEDLSTLIAAMLAGLDCSLVCAKTADEALALAAKDPPDLFIIDFMLPGANGYELIQSLLQHDRLRAVPRLMVTASANAGALSAAVGCEVSAFLTKPFKKSELFAACHKAMGGWLPPKLSLAPAPPQGASAAEEPGARAAAGLLSRAKELGASAVYLEPRPEQLTLRYRVEGALTPPVQLPSAQGTALAAYLKRQAGLEGRPGPQPQLGRFSLPGHDEMVLSTLPALDVEVLAVRLSAPAPELGLDAFGLRPAELDKLRRALSERAGLIALAGPARSGRSAALRVLLKELELEKRRAVLIEEKLGARLAGATQLALERIDGLTAARAVEAAAAQESDVVALDCPGGTGSLRAAVEAAGERLVIAVLEAQDGAEALSLLAEKAPSRRLLASRARAALSVRLVRKLCPSCKGAHAQGCVHCAGAGLRGHQPAAEALFVTPALALMIGDGASSSKLRDAAAKDGMRPLKQALIELLACGSTSSDEALKAAPAI